MSSRTLFAPKTTKIRRKAPLRIYQRTKKLPKIKRIKNIDTETGKPIFNPYMKPMSVAELKRRIARKNPSKCEKGIYKYEKIHSEPQTPETLIYRPKFETRLKAEIPGLESLKDYRTIKNLPNFDKQSSRVEGFSLIQAKHPNQFSTNFVLPDLRHNLDHSNMVYLDKGKYSCNKLDNYEISTGIEDKKDFRLYFKGLGIGDKDKEKFLGDN